MLLIIEIISLSNMLVNVDTQVLNYENPVMQSTSSQCYLLHMENNSTCCHSKLLYNQKESNISGVGVKYMKHVSSEDILNTPLCKFIFKIVSTLKNYVITSDGNLSEEGGIEFDPRRREDAYKKTDPREYPYAVAILFVYKKVKYVCSGSLLTAEWVLTAAHCVKDYGKGKIYVYAGGHSLVEAIAWVKNNTSLPPASQLIEAKEFLYNDQGLDTALIKLPDKFNLTDTVKTIQLSNTTWKHIGYKECVTTAFGSVSGSKPNVDDYSRKTQKLQVKQPCLCSFWFKLLTVTPIDDLFCAKPIQDYGVCFGDSGGGLVCDGKLVAVNMFILAFKDVYYCELNLVGALFNGIFGLNVEKCGEKNTLSVFQATCRSLPWINQHVKLFSNNDLSECAHLSSSGTLVYIRLWVILTIMSLILLVH